MNIWGEDIKEEYYKCIKQDKPDWVNTEQILVKDVPLNKHFTRLYIDVLNPIYLDIDYKICTMNKDMLNGLFGDNWPNNLTKSMNLNDLYWHYYSFINKLNFGWAILEDNSYIGCCYVLPNSNIELEVYIWFDKEYNYKFEKEFMNWINNIFYSFNIKLYTPYNKKPLKKSLKTH